MRVKIDSDYRMELFSAIQAAGLTWDEVASILNVSRRTVFDWQRGKYTIPETRFDLLIKASGLDRRPDLIHIFDDGWHTSEAGKKGARERIAKYGPLGTQEGRRQGGINSYMLRKDNLNDIFTAKTITEPLRSTQLAELIGILIGDGSITHYQVAVTVSSIVDGDYALFIAELFRELFEIDVTVKQRRDSNCIVILASSVALVKFLVMCELPKGHKLRHKLDMPSWILSNRQFSIACLRGIFDTDGCIFQEVHTIGDKRYAYPRLSFVSMSASLRQSIYKTLVRLGFSPRIRNNRSVNLERRIDIHHYFEQIGSHNTKHIARYKQFGGVG